MKPENSSVIICCAGMGYRLGIDVTKALIEINDKPLISYYLELLKDYDDIRVVVGYQANQVIDIVNKMRKDIMFVFNHDYATTGPGDSLKKGILGAREYTIVIDGDLLVHPKKFKEFLNLEYECIAFSERKTEEPIGINVNNNKAIDFSDSGEYEWPGIVKIKTSKLVKNDKYIYKIIEDYMPMKAYYLPSIDIDTIKDYKKAKKWMKNNYEY